MQVKADWGVSEFHTCGTNGNLLDDGQYDYSYDHANRLVGLSDDTQTYSYTHNGTGDRLSSTADGVTTHFVLDLNAGLTQVLSDGAYDYLYGVTRISQVSAGGTEYFLGDHLGSVRALVDESGTIISSKSYQPYGELSSQWGVAESSYGFTGEWTDPGGLVYLRARYYDPALGRFLSRDPWDGDMKNPQSYNKWGYGYSNPILFTDPSGDRDQKR